MTKRTRIFRNNADFKMKSLKCVGSLLKLSIIGIFTLRFSIMCLMNREKNDNSTDMFIHILINVYPKTKVAEHTFSVFLTLSTDNTLLQSSIGNFENRSSIKQYFFSFLYFCTKSWFMKIFSFLRNKTFALICKYIFCKKNTNVIEK